MNVTLPWSVGQLRKKVIGKHFSCKQFAPILMLFFCIYFSILGFYPPDFKTHISAVPPPSTKSSCYELSSPSV